MSLQHRGEYPTDWPTISRRTKDDARNRCVRCGHRFHYSTGESLPCDIMCRVSRRCRANVILGRGGIHNFGVHHLDGDKGNVRWWNLLPLCNSCHLSIQARVDPEQAYLWEHSDWFKPFVAGFYAWQRGLEVERAEIERDLPKYLAMGQPWLGESSQDVLPPPTGAP